MEINEGWEVVDKVAELWRFRIPSGWLVKHFKMFSLSRRERGAVGMIPQIVPLNASITMTFVPDPSHAWKLDDIPSTIPNINEGSNNAPNRNLSAISGEKKETTNEN